MKDYAIDLRNACCAEVGVPIDSPRAKLVMSAASAADHWYATHPMPCGGPAALKRHHAACKAAVSSDIRCQFGIVTWLSIAWYLLSLVRTVWRFREEPEDVI